MLPIVPIFANNLLDAWSYPARVHNAFDKCSLSESKWVLSRSIDAVDFARLPSPAADSDQGVEGRTGCLPGAVSLELGPDANSGSAIALPGTPRKLTARSVRRRFLANKQCVTLISISTRHSTDKLSAGRTVPRRHEEYSQTGLPLRSQTNPSLVQFPGVVHAQPRRAAAGP
jgi:hypothetical protein